MPEPVTHLPSQVEPRESTALPAVTAPPSPAEWTAMKQQAEVIYRSGLAPKSIRNVEQVLVIALKGRELSLPPMQALSHIHVVEGKPTLSAELMAALVQRAGHKIRVLETTADICKVEGVRANDPTHPQRVIWSMEDARTAGVAGKGNWNKYPAAMLRARAISALCRFAFADVLMGASYTPEELGADVTEEGEVIDASKPTEYVEESTAPDDEHEDLMNQVEDLLAQFADDEVDKQGARNYAIEGSDEARKATFRLAHMLSERDKQRAAPDPDEVEDAEQEEASEAVQQVENEPATRKQIAYLEALISDISDASISEFEDMAGKPLAEFTRADASEWIGRLSGREA